MKAIDFLKVIDDDVRVMFFAPTRVANPTPELHDRDVWKIELSEEGGLIGYDVYLAH